MKKIQTALNTGTVDLEESDTYLLNYSVKEIDEWTGAKKNIWLRLIHAAKKLKKTRVDEYKEQ